MGKKMFPAVPSALELEILSFVEYCNVCEIHDNKPHPIKLCIHCDKHICYLFDDNIWTLNNTGKEICQQCRSTLIKTAQSCTFISTKKYNIKKQNNSIIETDV